MLDFRKIKTVRMEKGLRQNYVSERVGISQSHYCNIENGRENPSLLTLEAIAIVLGGSVMDFLIEEANPTLPRKVARCSQARESGSAVVA